VKSQRAECPIEKKKSFFSVLGGQKKKDARLVICQEKEVMDLEKKREERLLKGEREKGGGRRYPIRITRGKKSSPYIPEEGRRKVHKRNGVRIPHGAKKRKDFTLPQQLGGGRWANRSVGGRGTSKKRGRYPSKGKPLVNRILLLMHQGKRRDRKRKGEGLPPPVKKKEKGETSRLRRKSLRACLPGEKGLGAGGKRGGDAVNPREEGKGGRGLLHRTEGSCLTPRKRKGGS